MLPSPDSDFRLCRLCVELREQVVPTVGPSKVSGSLDVVSLSMVTAHQPVRNELVDKRRVRLPQTTMRSTYQRGPFLAGRIEPACSVLRPAITPG